jgi:hypothetical protein
MQMMPFVPPPHRRLTEKTTPRPMGRTIERTVGRKIESLREKTTEGATPSL